MRNLSLMLLTVFFALAYRESFAQAPADIYPALAGKVEWKLTDPAYLYLSITCRGVPSSSLTWLHPTRNSSGWCAEAAAPGQTEASRAFAFHLNRVTTDGYEVTFQPIDANDPMAMRSIPGEVVKVIFPKAQQKSLRLTDKLSLVGFYGKPKMPPK